MQVNFYVCRILISKFGRPGHRWEDNIETDIKGTGWNDVDWIYLVHNRNQCKASANAAMNLSFPWKARSLIDQLSDSSALTPEPIKQLNKSASFMSSEMITNPGTAISWIPDYRNAAGSKHRGAQK
jgi:hypothetical protein